MGTDFSDGLDLKINGNGEIIAGGITKMDDTGARRIIIAKFSANGSLVTNFGNNGVYQQEELLGFDQSFATLLINSDDSINIVINLQSGTTYYDLLAVLKLTSAGELDTSFGDNGLYSIEYSGHKPASSASSLPDGSILIYGSQMDENENYKGMSSRITKNGILDTSFGENGYGNGYDGGGEEIVNYSRMISKNDRYVLIGDVLDLNGFVRKIIVSQINHDGTFVDTYGINGSSFFESPSSDYTGIRAMNAISEGNNFYIVGEVSLPDYKINPIIAKLIDNTLEVSDFTTIMSNAKISPNPVDETTFIHFESQENRMVNLSIVNSLGQIVSSREVDMKQGANNISLMQDTQILSKGFYFVNLSMDGKNLKSFKIIK